MPRPGLQRKRAAAALSQAGRAGPDQPIRAIHAHTARRPDVRGRRQTDRRQTSSSLNAPSAGNNNSVQKPIVTDQSVDIHLPNRVQYLPVFVYSPEKREDLKQDFINR